MGTSEGTDLMGAILGGAGLAGQHGGHRGAQRGAERGGWPGVHFVGQKLAERMVFHGVILLGVNGKFARR